jgi:hypothetical protein
MTLFALRCWYALTLRERLRELFAIIGTTHATEHGVQCDEALERLAAKR